MTRKGKSLLSHTLHLVKKERFPLCLYRDAMFQSRGDGYYTVRNLSVERWKKPLSANIPIPSLVTLYRADRPPLLFLLPIPEMCARQAFLVDWERKGCVTGFTFGIAHIFERKRVLVASRYTCSIFNFALRIPRIDKII